MATSMSLNGAECRPASKKSLSSGGEQQADRILPGPENFDHVITRCAKCKFLKSERHFRYLFRIVFINGKKRIPHANKTDPCIMIQKDACQKNADELSAPK